MLSYRRVAEGLSTAPGRGLVGRVCRYWGQHLVVGVRVGVRLEEGGGWPQEACLAGLEWASPCCPGWAPSQGVVWPGLQGAFGARAVWSLQDF